MFPVFKDSGIQFIFSAGVYLLPKTLNDEAFPFNELFWIGSCC